jgi:Fe-S oxidoreductase
VVKEVIEEMVRQENRMVGTWRSYIDAQRQDTVIRCTACGDCFSICPIVSLTPLQGASPEAVVAGVLDVLRGRPAPAEAVAWAEACTRCGLCIELCPERVNPRKMLALCEGLAHEAAGSQAGSQFFRLMSQNIRLLSGLQLSRQQLADIQGPSQAQADVVFYVGCNVLSTPHIILNVMDILSAIGVDYQVAGGVGYCCGAIHFIGGELDAAGKVTTNLFAKLAAFQPRTVLTWCPTCEMHLGETVAGSDGHTFDVQHVSDFLAAHLDVLKARMSSPVPRRIALHGHGGHPHISDNVRRLFGAIPGLDVVELDDGGELGYSCNVGGLLRIPSLQAEVQARVWQQARAAGASELVDLYHGCHRLLWDEEGLRIRNFTDLLVEAMGLPDHEDRFQRYREMPGVQQVIEAARDLMRENGVEEADVESVYPSLFRR